MSEQCTVPETLLLLQLHLRAEPGEAALIVAPLGLHRVGSPPVRSGEHECGRRQGGPDHSPEQSAHLIAGQPDRACRDREAFPDRLVRASYAHQRPRRHGLRADEHVAGEVGRIIKARPLPDRDAWGRVAAGVLFVRPAPGRR